MGVDASSLNRYLDSMARQINQNINAVDSHIDQVNSQVGRVARDVQATSAELQELRRRFEEYVNLQTRANAVQRATTEIVGLKADMDREFGKYQVVRDSTIGTLQALDIGIITKETVQRVSEELMMQTPRYWLAPAIVALAAWVRDDEDLAKRAVAESYHRDQAKCSLLFALILARQGRLDASAHWLKHYFNPLDPQNLPRDFAVVMEGAAREAFGPLGRVAVENQLAEWLTRLRDDPAKVRSQIQIWRKEITNQRSVVDKNEFDTLAKVSPTWPALQAQLESASALAGVDDKYRGIRDAPVVLSLSVRDQMDDLLERLVTRYDQDELPLRRKIVKTQAIIDHDGDLDRAQQEADALETALDERIDALTMQSYTAIAPELLGVSISTQQVSIGAAKSEFRQAVTEYTGAYRAQAKSDADINLDAQHSNYAIQYHFPGCLVNTAMPQQAAEQRIADTWRSTVQSYIEDVSFKPKKLTLPIVIAVIVIIIAFAINPIAGIVVLLLGAGAVALYANSLRQTAEREVAKVQDTANAATEYSIDMYRTAVGEFVDATLAYEDADAAEAGLLELIDGWHSAITTEEEA